MNKIAFQLIIVLIISVGCDSNKEQKQENKLGTISSVNKVEEEGLKLLQQNCYACHSVTSKSHDEIIAPPMVAVVRRYKMSYNTKESFVEAVTKWTLAPNNESALMRGAVKQFKVMPKQPFDKEEIIAISEYIYENELEKPSWFNTHFEKEHPNGMGSGNRNKNSKM